MITISLLGSSTRGLIFYPIFHHNRTNFEPNYHPRMDRKVRKKSIKQFLIGKYHPKFGFMFTRDPLDRALSAYFDRVLPNPALLEQFKSLDNYLRNLSMEENKNSHFRPQLSVCDPCRLNISFLGRTETMVEDLDYIVNDATKMGSLLRYTKNSENAKFWLRKTKYDGSYFRGLSLTTVKKFILAYRHDYVAFGYNPHQSLAKLKRNLDKIQNNEIADGQIYNLEQKLKQY